MGRRSRISIALWVLLLCTGAAAHAKTTTAKKDPCLGDERCNALYESARGLSRAGQYQASLGNYEAAYKLQPVPWLLVNIGRVQQKLGKAAAAIASYRLFLDGPGAGDADMKKKAEEYLHQAELDDERMKAEQKAQPGSAMRAPPAPASASGHDVHSGSQRGRLWIPGWALLGGGLAAVAAGAALWGVDGRQTCPSSVPYVNCPDVLNTWPGGVGLLAGGGAALISSAVMLGLSARARKSAEHAGLPLLLGLSCQKAAAVCSAIVQVRASF